MNHQSDQGFLRRLVISGSLVLIASMVAFTNSPPDLYAALHTNYTEDSLDYYPLSVGNTWTYCLEWDTTYSGCETVYDTVSVRGRLWFLHKGWTLDFIGSGPKSVDTVRSDSIGNVWGIDWEREYQLFDFTQDSGATYADRSSYPTESTVQVTRNLSIAVPAGTFANCVELYFGRSFVDESIGLIFAPGVGVIKFYGPFFAPSVLLRAIINGKTISGVEEQSCSIPSKLRLEQNFPNPFNTSSVITYEVPLTTHVSLEIYDLLGREVATLVNEVNYAGFHTVNWDASRCASGVYFSKLRAGKFVETKKMILLK